jgi:aminocarboxymuconate-semialdehyde decarboxylase
MVGRLAQAARKRPWAATEHKKDGAFEERLARLWFDTHLSDARALALLKQIAGTQRLTYGTNFAGWDQSDDENHGPIDPVLADNARRLLRRAAPSRA